MVVRRRTGPRARARGHQRGAAAVEFALITVVMVPLMLGILDYGLWFNESLNARQGVREAARQAVVKNIPATVANCGTSPTDMQKIKCMTRDQVGAVAGTTYAKVIAPQGWTRGRPLIVCVVVKVTGVTGITPLPGKNLVSSATQLSIEVDSPLPSGATANASSSAADTLPSGASWDSRC